MKRIYLLFLLSLGLSTVYGQWISQNTNFTTGSRGINYIHAVDANTVWATGYDGSGGGLYITEFTKTTDGGNLWTPGQVLTSTGYGLGNVCAIDGNTAWAAVYRGSGAQNATCGIYKTIDGGTTWVHQGCLAGSASFANNVYFWNGNLGMAHGDLRDGYFEIYTTADGGATWTRVPQASIGGLTVASDEAGWTGVINVVGNTVIFGTNKGNVMKSDDNGLTWTLIATGAPATGTNSGINDIAFKSPTEGLVGHVNDVTFMYDLFETNDGVNFTPITYSGNAFSNSIAYVPGTWDTYVCTGANTNLAGCAFSFDGGHTWTDFNGTTGIQFLATEWVDNATGWAGDFNDATTPSVGGMYKYNDVLTDILHIDPRAGGFRIYPNPGNGLFTLTVVGAENQTVQVEIFDMVGKMVYTAQETRSLVSYNLTLDMTGLPTGMYTARITSGSLNLQEKLIIR